MAADMLWRLAVRIVHPTSKPARVRLEAMSNEDLDHWLNDHRLTPRLTFDRSEHR
jgi:hypothetical protein